MGTDDKPIGYWLKHLDGPIESTFEQTLSDRGLTRRHWQVLNTLSTAPRTEAELAEALRPFWAEDAITLTDVLADLTARRWTDSARPDAYTLTPAGSDAHSAVAEQIGRTRRRLLDGLSPDDYRSTVRVLRQMSTNLETAD